MRAIMADDKEGAGSPEQAGMCKEENCLRKDCKTPKKLFKKEGGFNFNLIIALYNRAITKRGPQNEPLRI